MSAPEEMKITEELIRRLAAEISEDEVNSDIEGVVAAPAYGNGMTDAMRTFLSDEDALYAEISETLTVFA